MHTNLTDVQYNTIQYDTIRYDTTQRDATRCDAMRCDAQSVGRPTFFHLAVASASSGFIDLLVLG